MTNDELITTKDQQLIDSCLNNFFILLGLKDFSLVTAVKEPWIVVDLKTPDTGLVVGHNGETLSGLQLLLRLLLYRQLGRWVPLVLDSDGYLSKRQADLEKTAHNLAQKVIFSGQPQELVNLSAADRRIIHLYLQNQPGVMTESQDTKYGRKLVIKTKS
jgi:spoIIIJ-associated protein